MHRFIKNGLAVFFALTLLAATGAAVEAASLNAAEVAADMGEGWNLGNGLDAE